MSLSFVARAAGRWGRRQNVPRIIQLLGESEASWLVTSSTRDYNREIVADDWRVHPILTLVRRTGTALGPTCTWYRYRTRYSQ